MKLFQFPKNTKKQILMAPFSVILAYFLAGKKILSEKGIFVFSHSRAPRVFFVLQLPYKPQIPYFFRHYHSSSLIYKLSSNFFFVFLSF